MINYTQELRKHNLKATPQRIAISAALYDSGHINIDSLYDVMLKKFNSISLATIYKNINIMIENSFIQEVKIPHAKSVYELTKSTHSHMVCEKCGSIEDVSIDVKKLLDISDSLGEFKINSSSLVLSGECKHCKQ